MPKKTQNELLIEHFREEGSISNVEAQAVYKIRSLPRRICDLKENGYKFSNLTKTKFRRILGEISLTD